MLADWTSLAEFTHTTRMLRRHSMFMHMFLSQLHVSNPQLSVFSNV
jgi:hypothetical protein